jgi:hypothetical protein
MADLHADAERLRALWKSGRAKYASFFQVLEEVRAQIGDAALADWCIDNLQIGLTAINTTSRLLTQTDGEIVRANLAAARQAEQDAREERRRTRQREKAEHERKLAEIKHETTEYSTAARKLLAAEKRRQQRNAARRKVVRPDLKVVEN